MSMCICLFVMHTALYSITFYEYHIIFIDNNYTNDQLKIHEKTYVDLNEGLEET